MLMHAEASQVSPFCNQNHRRDVVLFHVVIKPRDHFFRVFAKVVVAIETTSGVFDPDEFLVFAAEEIKSLLAIFGRGPNVLTHLGHERGHLDTGGKQMGRHFTIFEASQTNLNIVHQIHVVTHALQLGELPHER